MIKTGEDFISEYYDELIDLIRRFCVIPSPSHEEDERVKAILAWLEEQGIEGAYADEAKNVVIPYKAGEGELDLFLAHTDVVFPDLTPLPLVEKEDYMAAPGIGDDTANFALLLLLARHVIRNNIPTRNGILFICNSCEEGQGNLKGSRQICKDFEGRIRSFTSFDCDLGKVVTGAVGSERYEISIRTEGGHSYAAFGNSNAITELAKVITALDNVTLPKEGKTTYNFGTISGGTGINVIAADAKLLYEYRSDDIHSLEYMRGELEKVIAGTRSKGIDISFRSIGVRPCSSGVDSSELSTLAHACLEKRGIEVKETPSSTDCNIPLSLGIPSVAFGVVKDVKPHTREEYIIPLTLMQGAAAAFEYMMTLTASRA